MALPTSLASRNGDEHGSRRCRTPGASEFQGCERRAKAVGLADGDTYQPFHAARDAVRDAVREAVWDAFPGAYGHAARVSGDAAAERPCRN